MSQDRSPADPSPLPSRLLVWLDRLTGIVLLLIVLALGWITLAPHLPGWGLLPSVELEVVAVLVLLTAGLLLVSVVALLHTR